MQQLTHIGLDVHKDTIAVAVLRHDSVTCDERVIPNTPEAIRSWTTSKGPRWSEPLLLCLWIDDG